jgi:cytochrome c oxidase subunit 2
MKTLKAIWHSAGRLGLAAGAVLGSSTAMALNDLSGGPAVNQIDLPASITEIGRDQVWLHNFMLIICTVIFNGVFGVMFYSIFKHRKSRGAKTANFH